MRVLCGFALVFVTALLTQRVLAADATTQPATRPSVKAPIPKAWAMIENKTNHFKYRVPPQWSKQQSTDTATVLKLPEPTGNRSPLDLHVGRFVAIAGPCHATTIEDDAKDFRSDLAKQQKDAKIVKDEATELGGRPAWLFIFETRVTMKMITSGPGGQSTREIKKVIRTYEINTVQGKTHYYISFEADPNTYASNLATAQRVLDSLEWTN